MNRFSNNLTDAQQERLAILIEELGEAAQVAGKILRHGYDSCHPFTGIGNIDALERELGDVRFAIWLLVQGNDISESNVDAYADSKVDRIQPYLHHQQEIFHEPPSKE